jgi:general secretion pathway protein D
MLLPILAIMGCERPRIAILDRPPQTGLTNITGQAGALRLSGPLGSPDATPPAQVSYGPALSITTPTTPALAGGGDISLNFAETDIREVVSQILGGILRATYTIDPGVSGTATLRTAQPVARAQLLPILQTLLAQNGATLVQAGGIYRVLPAGAAPAAPAGAVGPRAGAAPDGAR